MCTDSNLSWQLLIIYTCVCQIKPCSDSFRTSTVFHQVTGPSAYARNTFSPDEFAHYCRATTSCPDPFADFPDLHIAYWWRNSTKFLQNNFMGALADTVILRDISFVLYGRCRCQIEHMALPEINTPFLHSSLLARYWSWAGNSTANSTTLRSVVSLARFFRLEFGYIYCAKYSVSWRQFCCSYPARTKYPYVSQAQS